MTACEIAEHTGKISNEILSRLGGRLEKYVIFKGGKKSV